MTEDQEASLHGPHDHPVIATLAGCAVLVAAAVLAPRFLPAHPWETLIGAGAGAGFLLWLIGFVVTTRRSTLAWKAGSLLILIGAGALAGHLAHRQYEASGRQDPSSFAEMEFGPQGIPILPKDVASRGPVSRLFAASVQADASERRAYDAALATLGVGNLSSPYLLTQNPQTIAKCADREAIKTLALQHAATRAERGAALGREIQIAGFGAPLKEAIRAIALPDARHADAKYRNQLRFIDATAELCTLLAKRGWVNDNGYFGFNAGGDAARYKALQAQRAALASESEKLDKDALARMKAAQEKVRAALS